MSLSLASSRTSASASILSYEVFPMETRESKRGRGDVRGEVRNEKLKAKENGENEEGTKENQLGRSA